MKPLWSKALRFRKAFRQLTTAAAGLLLAAPAFAQGNSPWENAVNVLQQAFTSTIARGLSLVAIVVSGLTFAFGEGGSNHSEIKRDLYTANFVFVFKSKVPNELIPINPLGVAITYFREDQAFK
jgi:type IV secretory pathway VirB2 component (pilin)